MTRTDPKIRAILPRTVPVATLSIAVITAAVTLVQFADPAVLDLLRRNPQALAAGQWWRVGSSLLVHDGGWLQFMPNMVGIVLIGMALEPLIGPWRILALYLAGGLAGKGIA